MDVNRNKNLVIKNEQLSFHENILDILFKHKNEVYKKLVNLIGVFLIEHIAIKIIDPKNKAVIFSISPSVEYNLIIQNLWKYDKSFSNIFNKNKKFYFWEEAYSREYYSEIKSIKELKHGFSIGFNLSKVVNDFILIYSYATRSKNKNLMEYYHDHINELVRLGDYGYGLIHNIYKDYCDADLKAPILINEPYQVKPSLKLIVNNKFNLNEN